MKVENNKLQLNIEFGFSSKASDIDNCVKGMEITDKTLIMSDLASGMVVLDATEPKRFGIIAALIENNYIANDLTTFTKISLPLQSFKSYQNNLK
jgi:hypothetical protein